jgi:hypothetical protein
MISFFFQLLKFPKYQGNKNKTKITKRFKKDIKDILSKLKMLGHLPKILKIENCYK